MVLPGIPHHVTQLGKLFRGFRTCHRNSSGNLLIQDKDIYLSISSRKLNDWHVNLTLIHTVQKIDNFVKYSFFCVVSSVVNFTLLILLIFYLGDGEARSFFKYVSKDCTFGEREVISGYISSHPEEDWTIHNSNGITMVEMTDTVFRKLSIMCNDVEYEYFDSFGEVGICRKSVELTGYPILRNNTGTCEYPEYPRYFGAIKIVETRNKINLRL